jgi:hypothetical protein
VAVVAQHLFLPLPFSLFSRAACVVVVPALRFSSFFALR